MSSIVTATINELINKYHRLTKYPFYSHQDDDIACFDRIVRNYAILNSRKVRIPDNIYKLNLRAHDLMKFQNQIRYRVTKTIYKSTEIVTLHGQGKGTGNACTIRTFIGVPKMKILEEIAPDYITYQLQKWTTIL